MDGSNPGQNPGQTLVTTERGFAAIPKTSVATGIAPTTTLASAFRLTSRQVRYDDSLDGIQVPD